jgi:hypothetical protein
VSRNDRAPDPLGKRALFWVPAAAHAGGSATESSGGPGSTGALPVGKHALYSAALPDATSRIATSGNPIDERGSFTVRCARCNQTSHVGVLDLLIYQLPLGVWLPRGAYDHRMTCPACRKRAWCSVTLRRH